MSTPADHQHQYNHMIHHHHQQQQRDESIDRIFPRCRKLRSPTEDAAADTAVLIDLSDDITMTAANQQQQQQHGESDSDTIASGVPPPSRRPPATLMLNHPITGTMGVTGAGCSGPPLHRHSHVNRYGAGPERTAGMPAVSARYSAKTEMSNFEMRRNVNCKASSSSVQRRPRSIASTEAWMGLYDAYGGGAGAGYEPSSDSEPDEDSDSLPFGSKSAASASTASGGSASSSVLVPRSSGNKKSGVSVRTSASESHIVGNWRKTTAVGVAASADQPTQPLQQNRRHHRSGGVKEIYDLTPSRPIDLGSPSTGSGSASGGGGVGGGGGGGGISSLLEIAGGREVVSRSRTRSTQRKRHLAAAAAITTTCARQEPLINIGGGHRHLHNNNKNNNNSSSSSSAVSASSVTNRYSGEVYFEESVGRYGFHVGSGGGNATLWGSQGLEPSFSIPNSPNDKPNPSASESAADGTHGTGEGQGQKRPLSWAGDDALVDQKQSDGAIGSPSQGRSMEEGSAARDCSTSKAIRGYLTDFYPEVAIASPTNGDQGEEGEDQSVLSAIYDHHLTGPPTATSGPVPPLNLDNYLSEQLNQFAQQSSRREANENPSSEEPTPTVHNQQHQHQQQQQLTVAGGTTVIGSLTIAQYEGSPRRYGVRPHQVSKSSSRSSSDSSIHPDPDVLDESATTSPPPASYHHPFANPLPLSRLPVAVPGFPRRVTSTSEVAPHAPTFSPSATRQTLADLVLLSPTSQPPPMHRSPAPPSSSHRNEGGVEIAPSNAVIMPWHLELVASVTPATGHAREILDPVERRDTFEDEDAEGSLNGAETDLGETEVGLEMGKSRNFTLSPETTDYDDSELGGGGCGGVGGSGSDSSRRQSAEPLGSQQLHNGGGGGLKGQFNSMPVLEDGLSSGRSSAASGGGGEWRGPSGSDVAVSHCQTEEEEDEEDDDLVRIPLMTTAASAAQRHHRHRHQRVQVASSSSSVGVHHSLQHNGSSLPHRFGQSPSSSAAAAVNAVGLPVVPSPSSSNLQQQQQQHNLWVKKLPGSSHPVDCDRSPPNHHHHHHHHQLINQQQQETNSCSTTTSTSGVSSHSSFRARDATPPPPAPIAHRGPLIGTTTPLIAAAVGPIPPPPPPTTVSQFPTVNCSGGSGTSPPRLRLSSVSNSNSSSSVDKSTAVGTMHQQQQQQQQHHHHQFTKGMSTASGSEFHLQDLNEALALDQQAAPTAPAARSSRATSLPPSQPVWVPRPGNDYWAPSTSSPTTSATAGGVVTHQQDKLNDEDDERETDQLLRDPDDQGFFDSRPILVATTGTPSPPLSTVHPSPPPPPASQHHQQQQQQQQQQHQHPSAVAMATAALANGANGPLAPLAVGTGTRQSEPRDLKYRDTTSTSTSTGTSATAPTAPAAAKKNPKDPDNSNQSSKKKGRSKEVMVHEPAVLIEGVLFRANYLGSTQIVCEGQPTKYTRMMQAEEAVSRIKALAPEGETQPTTEVDLFISTEKIMVLNTELKEIMMDHALRTISYIADIGDLVVLMARRRVMSQDGEDCSNKIAKTPKMVCHVFESEEAQFIAQSIGQAFQVAYMEFLKANGIEDQSFVREMDYQEVLNSQEIFGDELQMFAKKELQKEVIVPKARNEILGVVIVESGWGSMLPTVVIANLAPAGAAARCGQLNIGDQIIAINGISLVGLPLSTCQTYIKNAKSATVVKLTVVPCPPVVEVKIKRPDTKYQLGFSVQNGVICSLLRGGIAERGGVRVGHRIIEINGQSVVAVPHERIVGLLATSVGEINMKTMPTSMFRLLIGQETPVYI